MVLLRAVDRALQFLIASIIRGVVVQLELALRLEGLRRRLPDRVRRWSGSLRRFVRRIFVTVPPVPPPVFRRRRRPWNRTPDHIEEEVARLHVEHPWLGSAALRCLARRVLAWNACCATVRKILLRRRDLVMQLQQQRRRRPRRIRIRATRLLWGLDLTLVWLLGFIPVWIVGVVDYHGSRLVGLRRVVWPTSAAVIRVLDEIFQQDGTPVRLLTDNAPILPSAAFEGFLAERGIRHSRIRPGHAWTNGRIERLFRTFKETVYRYTRVFTSLRQIDHWCADFVVFHNRDRPHASYGGLTPNEVMAGARLPASPRGRVTYFDGRMRWYAFG
jgi:transposase InsO family protein